MPFALLYHGVTALPAGTPADQRTLVVEPLELAWQFQELARRGFTSVTLDEYYEAVSAGEQDPSRVLLTFDDAYAHLLCNVTPLLAEHGFTAALFVPWGHVGGANGWDEAPSLLGERIATAAELRELSQGPWELASHSLRHVDLRTLDGAERRRQLALARDELSALAGREISDLAYPFGAFDDAVRSDARRTGHRMAFAAGPVSVSDPFALPRLTIRGQEGRTAFTVKLDAQFRDLFR